MKRLARFFTLILMVMLYDSASVYAATYISLHGADTGATGNVSEMYYNFSSTFRVLIPPGATYFSLSMICDNQAVVTTVARFGQAPSGYYPLPSYSPPSAKTLDQARTGNILSGNSDGLLNIALQYFYPQPLAESQAGWLYVDIVGSGVRHIDYNLSVNASVYTEWYNRSKGYIDCSCAMMGQCAMCPAGGGTCTSPVTANFSASSTTITAGASVSFTNTTSGSASYSWSFGDGSSYTGGTPSAHTYSNVGLYNVTLTATPTDTRCPVSTKTQTITVNQQCVSPVTANFSASSTSITQGGSVLFSNASSGSISTYTWSFGDGSSYSGASPPAHTYSTNGTYTITLTVSPSDSKCSVSTKTISIVVNPTFTCSSGTYCQGNPSSTTCTTACQPYYTCVSSTCPSGYAITLPNGSSACSTQCSSSQCTAQCNPWQICSGGNCIYPTQYEAVEWTVSVANVAKGGISKQIKLDNSLNPPTSSPYFILSPILQFPSLTGSYDFYAVILDSSGMYVARTDRIGNIVFIDLFSGDKIRSYQTLNFQNGLTLNAWPFRDVFEDLMKELRLSQQACIDSNYRFYVGVAPAGTDISTASGAASLYAAELYCNIP